MRNPSSRLPPADAALREPFDDPAWLFEPKYDGYRGLLYVTRKGCWIRSKRWNILRRFEQLCWWVREELPVKEAATARAAPPPQLTASARRPSPAWASALATPKSATRACPSAIKDVLGLEVAVDYSLTVRVVECGSDVAGEIDCHRYRELTLAPELVTKSLSAHVGHREPQGLCSFAGVEHRNDVGVVQPGGKSNFSQEPIRSGRGGQLGVEDIEGNQAVVLKIVGEVDGGHPTTSELALERVTVGQHGPEPCHGLGQRDLSDWGVSRL